MDLFDITGKVAIVTGGNGGLGLGIGRGLAQAGASIAIVGRNEPKCQAAARLVAGETGRDVAVFVADVSQAAQIASTVAAVLDRFGRIDILVNNAGTTVRKPPHEMSLDEWQSVLDVNLTSAFLMSKEVYPALRQAGGGKVINIGSIASLYGQSYAPAYAASKAGLVQLTKSCALAWARDNIQVNVILPGWFETEMTDRAKVEVAGLNERVLAKVPAGRWAQPPDIAGTAIWLASRASDFVTGAAIPVDGGYSSVL